MRIGIDARFYGPKGKGLGRYVQKLLQHLEETEDGSSHRYFVFLKKENFDLYQPQSKNFEKVVADFSWYGFKEQLFFPLFLNKYKLDLMHFCHFNVPVLYRKRFVVTIHDLILFHYPTVRNTTLNKAYYKLKLVCYQWTIRSAAKRALKIISVSNFTKSDIVKNLLIDEAKIQTTYEGCDLLCHLPKNPVEDILKKYGIMRPYLLYVGNAYPHKNLERLALAFKRVSLKQENLSLVLVGGRDYFFDRLKKRISENKIERIVFPGFVPDDELDVLYKEAELYVFPSLYEGFGLPPLEALTKNTHVISSCRTSMPEILGDLADYFDPQDENDIAGKILDSLNNKKKIDRSLLEEKMKKFNWRRMAQETKEIYLELCTGKNK